jgi:hypothetical protein
VADLQAVRGSAAAKRRVQAIRDMGDLLVWVRPGLGIGVDPSILHLVPTRDIGPWCRLRACDNLFLLIPVLEKTGVLGVRYASLTSRPSPPQLLRLSGHLEPIYDPLRGDTLFEQLNRGKD